MESEDAFLCQAYVEEHVRCTSDNHAYAIESSKLVITPKGIEYTFFEPLLQHDSEDDEDRSRTMTPMNVTRVPSWFLASLSCERCVEVLVEIFARHCVSPAAAYNFVVTLASRETHETRFRISQCCTLVAVDSTRDIIGDLVLKSCLYNNIFLANYTVFVLTSLQSLRDTRQSFDNRQVMVAYANAGMRFAEIVFQRRLLERAICTANHPAINWLLWNGADCTRQYPDDTPRNAFLLAVEVFSFLTSKLERSPGVCPMTEKDGLRTLQLLLGHHKHASQNVLSHTRSMLFTAFLRVAEQVSSEQTVPTLKKILLTYRLMIMVLTTIGHRLPSSFFAAPFSSVHLFPSTAVVSERSAVNDCYRSLQSTDAFAFEFHRRTNFWKVYRHVLYEHAASKNDSSGDKLSSGSTQVVAASPSGPTLDEAAVRRLFVLVGSTLLRAIHTLDMSLLSCNNFRELLYKFLFDQSANASQDRIASNTSVARLVEYVENLENPVTREV